MSRLTDPSEIAEAQAFLKEARAAKHALSTGQGVASFRDQNGEEVTYSKADLGRLDAYIFELRNSLGLIDHGASAPMEVFFG